MQVVIVKMVKKMMMNCHVWSEVKVKETVSDEARGDQWGVRSIDKVRSIPKRAICDFQRGAGRWASKSDHRWRIVCCDKVEQKSSRGDVEVGLLWEPYRLEKGVYVWCVRLLSRCRYLSTAVMWEDFGVLVTARAREFFLHRLSTV